MIGPSMKRTYTVFGRRSGPEESSVHGTDAATGSVWGTRKPPSFETRTALASAGALTSSLTFRSRVYCAPELIEMPRSDWPPVAVIFRLCVAVPALPLLSVTRRLIGTVAGAVYVR